MKNKIISIFGILVLLGGLVLGGIGIKRCLNEANAGESYEELKVELDIPPLQEIPEAEEQLENPIDFKTLKAKYPDVYAWIRIPGTKVDYPIAQRAGEDEDDYYLHHTLDGRKRLEGAIYTESLNSKDFTDPNTVIYGHNMKNGSMFKTLHKYKDKKFFSENSEIFIYMEGKILRYKIFAAYLYDDRHLLKSFDFNDENIFRIYLNNVLTNKKMSSNMDMMVKVSENDRIITLSTCDARDNQRYLVQAVLLSIQESPQE